LEAVHASALVAFGISWWRMPLPAVIHCTSPASCGLCCRAIAVRNFTGKHVGDGLDATVRVPGKPAR